MPDNNIAAPVATSNRMPVVLLDWRHMPKGALRGFAKVRIGKALVINDVTILASHGRRWAGMPGKPQINRDGVVLKDDKGKVRYSPVVEWADKASADAFSESVIAAVEAAHPGATAAE